MVRWITSQQATSFMRELAQKVPLEVKPASAFIPPAAGNSYNPQDTPTLAGKVAINIYDHLTKRGAPLTKTPTEFIKAGRDAITQFPTVISRHAPGFTYGSSRTPGQTSFHHDTSPGDTPMATSDFLYYFNTSGAHRKIKRSAHPEVRGYITIKQTHANKIPELFVKLVKRLKDANVEFDAKATSPYGAETRNDHMVFYIPQPHQEKARDVMKKFLEEEKVGEGKAGQSPIVTNIAGSTAGLSWAFEPDQEEIKIGHEISGASTGISHNRLAALAATPHYLERIAQAHEQTGNHKEAKIFRDEAKRVEHILAR